MALVRSASEEDSAEIRRLLAESGWAQRVEDDARFGAMLSNARCLVVDEGGSIVGFGRAITDGVSNGYLSTVVIREDRRGNGYGRMLVDELMGDDPAISWVLRAGRNDSIGFWEALGFVRSEIAMERPRS